MPVVALAGGERWFRDFSEEDVRFVLMSYHNLRKNRHLPDLITYLTNLKESSTEYNPSWVMMDSGVFSLRQMNTGLIPDSTLDGYARSYIDFLRTEAGDAFHIVAEIDYPQDVLDDTNRVILDGYERVKAWRNELYEVVGRRLMPVLMNELTWKEKVELCKDPRFDWVALPSFPNDMPSHFVVSQTQKHVSLAHKYGKKIHLFAQTNLQTNMPYLMNADAMDSTTWISGDKHGMTFIFQKGKITPMDHSQSYRRAFYKGYYGKIGCDWEKIMGEHREHWEFCEGPGSRTSQCEACTDQIREVRKSALIAWKKFQRYLITRDPRRRNHGTNKSHGQGGPTGKPMKNSKEPRKKPKARKWSRKKPKFFKGHRPSGLSVSDHEVDESKRVIRDEDDGNDKEEPIVHEESSGAAVRGGLDGKSGQEHVSQHYVDNADTVGGPVDSEGGAGAESQDPEPPTDPMLLPVIHSGGTNLEKLRAGTPGYMCDTCPIEDSCPESKPGAVCFFAKKHWEAFDTRDPDSLRGALEYMIDLDKERTLMAMMHERVQTGGVIDRRVSEQMDGFMRRSSKLIELQHEMGAGPAQAIHGAHTQINAQQVTIGSTSTSEPSILTQLFSGPPVPPQPEPVDEIIDVPPPVTQDT